MRSRTWTVRLSERAWNREFETVRRGFVRASWAAGQAGWRGISNAMLAPNVLRKWLQDRLVHSRKRGAPDGVRNRALAPARRPGRTRPARRAVPREPAADARTPGAGTGLGPDAASHRRRAEPIATLLPG